MISMRIHSGWNFVFCSCICMCLLICKPQRLFIFYIFVLLSESILLFGCELSSVWLRNEIRNAVLRNKMCLLCILRFFSIIFVYGHTFGNVTDSLSNVRCDFFSVICQLSIKRVKSTISFSLVL